MTDIEKIARAWCGCIEVDPDADGYSPANLAAFHAGPPYPAPDGKVWHGFVEYSKQFKENLKSQGLVIVPREPTEGMLEASGPVRGWDPMNTFHPADECHTDWYKAMITAYEEEQ